MGIPATKKDGDCVSLSHPSHPPASLLTINRRLCDFIPKRVRWFGLAPSASEHCWSLGIAYISCLL
jgi:hypothetical protein